MDGRRKLVQDYVLGELPPDLRTEFETALAHDTKLQELLSAEKRLDEAIRSDAQRSKAQLSLALEEKKERLLGTVLSYHKPSPSLWWKSGLTVPIPLAAALGLAIIGVFTLNIIFRQPTSFGPQSSSVASNMPDLRDVAMRTDPEKAVTLDNKGVEITIQVKDLNHLLALLEGGLGSSEIRVQLPANSSVDTFGEPMLIKASER